MPYPNSFKEYAEEILEDHDGSDIGAERVLEIQNTFMAALHHDAEKGRLQEVLGLDPGYEPMDLVEAVMRTQFALLFPGPSYDPREPSDA